ncbi:hypothetical protein [Serratia oryzae]|uniref:hypothetical protein n=1 Tax=Serratia oryzae TaxID=2034155 RepID=UPI0012E2555F|nr:hypothetical protein [Serratia oryzae]
MSGKTKAKAKTTEKVRVSSEAPSAVSHRTKLALYKRLGFNQQKIFLGKDAREKLAFLVSLQHGEEIDDLMTVSDVLSYCINACYNSKSVQEEVKKRGGLPRVVKAAKTPEGQRLYRYYQMAQVGDAGDLVDDFNYTDKRGVPYFPHTNDVKANIDLGDLYLDQDDDEETDDEDQWSTVEIQALRKRQAISQAIKKLNKKALPKTRKHTVDTTLDSEASEQPDEDTDDGDWAD